MSSLLKYVSISARWGFAYWFLICFFGFKLIGSLLFLGMPSWQRNVFRRILPALPSLGPRSPFLSTPWGFSSFSHWSSQQFQEKSFIQKLLSFLWNVNMLIFSTKLLSFQKLLSFWWNFHLFINFYLFGETSVTLLSETSMLLRNFYLDINLFIESFIFSSAFILSETSIFSVKLYSSPQLCHLLLDRQCHRVCWLRLWVNILLSKNVFILLSN